MSGYAEPEDLPRFGIKAAALVPIKREDQQKSLDAASALADSYFRQRYGQGLPFRRWGDDVRSTVCQLAAYDLLITRGFNPAAGADMHIAERAETARAWLRDVARQMATPDVEIAAAGGRPSYDAPRIISRKNERHS